MSRRLFVFLVVLLCALGALLLLSALIESPTAQDAAPVELPVAHTITTFVSMPPTPTSAPSFPAAAWSRLAALFAVVAILIPRQNCTCDANGRVLCKRRYSHSFYPVFKQDLACG
jgi:hypothetical protein